MINQEGWLEQSSKIPSPNFDDRPINTEIKLIVIHNISLPPENFNRSNIEKLFLNKLDFDSHEYFKEIRDLRVSSHFLIDREGQITQFVSVYKRAWHAGKSNFENEDNCNDFSIGIEMIGSDNSIFENKQYASLKKLIKSLKKVFPKILEDNIVGHSDIAAGRKTDPGPFFDWTKIR